MNRALRLALVLVPTAVALVLAPRLHFSGDLSALFPTQGSAAMLGRVTRAMGGGDSAMVLARGDDPAEVASAATAVEVAMRALPSVTEVIGKPPTPSRDPTLAWRYAGPAARASLAAAVTPEGMGARLAGSRELLLSPTAGSAEAWLAGDPLRLALIPWESRVEVAAGASGDFSADQGRARIVVVQAKGRAFDPDAATAFVRDARGALDETRRAHPGVHLSLTGGHAVAVATRAMLQRDLALSGSLSMALAALAFALTFRRLRALIAVMPPLLLGTLWTLGGAALLPDGLSAMSIAFAAVVVGVGVDTGVHVYAALLEGRRLGRSPRDAAAYARKKTVRPTLLAAVAAALTFASLSLSELRALRELGVLCGAGELLTSVAIVLVTPEIGCWLERGPPPKKMHHAWIEALLAATRTRARAACLLLVPLAAAVALALRGGPLAGDAIVALRPRALEPLQVQAEIFSLFGGKPGQWMVVSADADESRARDRADRVAETLDTLQHEGLVAGYDALASYAPGPSLLAARSAERDGLALPALQERLRGALLSAGWDAEACASGLEAFARPSALAFELASPWLAARHLARDGSETLAVSYLRTSGTPSIDALVQARILAADPGAIITGYPFLERGLKDTLARDLPKIALVALLLAVLALSASLRSVRDVVLATATLALALALLAISMRLFGIRWHAYDALVVPVLLGITMDEAMFLLHAAQADARDATGSIERSLREQGPLVLATAMTTSAGFGALVVCRFEGLRDVGAVGALGSLAGLVAALVVVPAGLRLKWGVPTSSSDR